jgi:hypothetical protein
MSDKNNENLKSFKLYRFAGMALDPIHVGTGGSRLGRVDNAIVRDPVTRIPKIPGSSLAGVMRAYTAMAKGRYPDCAGLGQSERDSAGGHCREHDCPVCTVFGFATGKDHGGGFAGLASFSDMHVLLFPVATQLGPRWLTSDLTLRESGIPEFQNIYAPPDQEKIYCKKNGQVPQHLNIGWLYLPLENDWDQVETIPEQLEKGLQVPAYIANRLCSPTLSTATWKSEPPWLSILKPAPLRMEPCIPMRPYLGVPSLSGKSSAGIQSISRLMEKKRPSNLQSRLKISSPALIVIWNTSASVGWGAGAWGDFVC